MLIRGDAKFISCSQAWQDLLILYMIRKSDGFYVDVGANHPQRMSDTASLYQMGWSGVNIEPQPLLCALQKQARPRDTNLCVGIGDCDAELMFSEGGDDFGLSTFDARFARGGRKYTVPVINLSKALMNVTVKVDLLKIDVEGFERKVLLGFDFHVRPTLIMIEATRPLTMIPTQEEWEAPILSRDYIFVGQSGVDRFYVDRAAPSVAERFMHVDQLKAQVKHFEQVGISLSANRLFRTNCGWWPREGEDGPKGFAV
jgi:FkbM family methyltransferase